MFSKKTKLENLERCYLTFIKSDFYNFGEHLQFLYQLIAEDELLFGLVQELETINPFTKETIYKIQKERRNPQKELFKSKEEYYSYHWHLLKYLLEDKGFNIHHYGYFGHGFDEIFPNIINHLIKPIGTYLQDKLEDENSINYVLTRYKRRVEWFFREELSQKYFDADKNFEELLDKDLKLYLFDQGLENPISKPNIASGSPDLIGNIDKKDAFILEIKILDKKKSYRKDRVISGFVQAYKYAVDFIKAYAHVVIFNFDNSEIVLESSEANGSKIPSIKINNKIIFCIVINMNFEKTASQLKTIGKIEISEKDILKFISEENSKKK